jgi:hypothetical protein
MPSFVNQSLHRFARLDNGSILAVSHAYQTLSLFIEVAASLDWC